MNDPACNRHHGLVRFGHLALVLACAATIAASTAHPAAAACIAPPSDMIAWWSGDGTPDDIQGLHDATLTGTATYGTGKVAQAFSFDGAGYVEASNGPSWDLGSNAFTIDLWVNFNVVQGRDPFISHDEADGDVDKWIFWYDATGHRSPFGPALRFHINGPTLGAIDTVVAPWSPVTGQWYHLAVTRSGSTYKLYIDGIPVITEVDANAIQDAGAPLQIGAAEAFRFNGLIDEVEVFNRALSDAEIDALFDAGPDGKCKDSHACVNEGGSCDDGNACTSGDTCTSGLCAGTLKCAALDDCHEVGVCNPFTSICSDPEKPDDTVCNDDDACTLDDVCTDGTCAGDVQAICAPLCPDEPIASGCRSGESLKGKLSMKDQTGTAKDQARFGWKKNLLDLPVAALGDPLTDTGYALCVYDYDAGVPSLALTARVGPGGTCGVKPCWKTNGTSTAFQYSNKTGSSDGITKVRLKSGTAGKAQASVQAKGGNLLLPAPAVGGYLNQDMSVRAQLINSEGTCFEASYSPANSKNNEASFSSKND